MIRVQHWCHRRGSVYAFCACGWVGLWKQYPAHMGAV